MWGSIRSGFKYPKKYKNKNLEIMDIKKIKEVEISEIYDFLEGIQDYGHIYHYPPEMLDEPFKKILEGIEEVQELMKGSFEM